MYADKVNYLPQSIQDFMASMCQIDDVVRIPEGVSHAGSNLSAISLALSRKTLSPKRSYAQRSPPTTLEISEIRQ